MKHLIINALPEFVNSFEGAEVLNIDDYNIGNCTGCTNCWLKTPGVCAVKDDWALIFKKFLKADTVTFITEAKLGFVSYKIKNIVDRLIPIVVPYTKIYKGETRHISRYDKSWRIGLIYKGIGDKELLEQWMERFTLNIHSKSLGVYDIDESEVLQHELNNIQFFTTD